MPSHYLNQCWVIVNWTLWNKVQWNFNQNTKLFIQKNASENIVCEMASILSRGRWVKEFLTLFLSQSVWRTGDPVALKLEGSTLTYSLANVFSVMDALTCVNRTTTWRSWRLKSPANRLFVQPWHRLKTKEISKLPITDTLWAEAMGDRWITCTLYSFWLLPRGH